MGLKNSVSLLAPAARRVRVIIADPYPVILCGLRKMIEDDSRFLVVAAVSTMTRFMMMVREEQPDIVLLDSHMVSQHLEALPLLRSKLPPTSIILLTGSEIPEEVRDGDKLGQQPTLSKWCTAEALRQALSRAVPVDLAPKAGGLNTVPAAHAAATLEDPALRMATLTKREKQLLPLVCSGMKNKEIAHRLGISESTVWHHLTAVFMKLEVEDRLGLVAFAYRHQLIQAQESLLPVQSAQSA